VADVRAETPTAAAVLAVPDTNELREYLGFLENKLQENLQYWIEKKAERLSRLDLDAFRKGFLARIDYLSFKNTKLSEDMHQQMNRQIQQFTTRIEQNNLILEHLNPKSIMGRGYAAITTENGTLITTVANVQVRQRVALLLQDGTLDASVDRIRRK